VLWLRDRPSCPANDITGNGKRRVYQKLSSLGLIEHLTTARAVRTMPETNGAADPLAGLRDALDLVAGK